MSYQRSIYEPFTTTTTTTSGPSSLIFDNVGAIGSMTGSLGPGTYLFGLENVVINGSFSGPGGSSVGEFSFTLTGETNGNGVPDAGSTVVMLGMALTAIGGIRHKLL